MQRLTPIFMLSALILIACDQNTPPQTSRADKPQPVYTVDAVTVERPDNTGAVVIKASGTVRSGGWMDARLQQESAQQAQGVVTYRLVATPPPKNTNVTQVILPIDASLRVTRLPPDTKSIRVEAETNQTETNLPMEEPGVTMPPGSQRLPQ